MKVYRNISEFPASKKRVVLTTGTFDGVHKGHLKVINQLRKEAEKINGESVILTFFPHPRMILQPNSDIKLLNTIDEKINLLSQTGIDNLIIHPFSKEFANTSSKDFVENIICKKLNTKALVIGYDHQFGKNREGSFAFLKENEKKYGFTVNEISALDINEVNVSSTKIRNAILQGNINEATTFLGRYYSISGIVVSGNNIGNTINFPTANINIPEKYKLIPSEGVYAVKVLLNGKKYNGMLNIGKKPTVSNSNTTTIEVNIFNFSESIYGKKIQIEFIKRIREEQKFNTINELKEQLKKDKLLAQTILCE